TLKPSFDKNIFVYYDTVAYATSSLAIGATANHPGAVVAAADTDSKTLDVGNNSFAINVTAEDNSFTATYTVNVYRKSNDATLSALTVSVGTLNPSFTPATTDYNVTVNDETTEIEIGATATHANATVSGDGIKQLSYGTNRFDIIVTAEDESYSQTYTVNLYRNCPPDMRDQNGNSYGVELIGCNCWTTSNLKSTHYYDGTPVPFAEGYYAEIYPDTAGNITTFGRLYDWASASRGEAPDADGYIQGVCPEGWALPTLADFECLLALGSEAIRHDSTAFWLNDHTATNSSGFGAVPAGYYENSTASFIHLLGEGYIWIGEPASMQTAKACTFLFGCPETTIVSIPTRNGVSVRCIKTE
ncbi:cadherin-like beta sandwich domain-containing protein, partial [Bacteroidales bacterium OttesenSCG-928-E04]|nr:cadherin-like beta sandwich domain-containing protein [Bacteroidales bacterium OttesenSCG-928-E04]